MLSYFTVLIHEAFENEGKIAILPLLSKSLNGALYLSLVLNRKHLFIIFPCQFKFLSVIILELQNFLCKPLNMD